MGGIGFLDIIILLLLLLAMALGFSQGVVRQLISLGSLYITVVISAFIYRFLGRVINLLNPSIPLEAAEAMAFILILFLSYNFLFWNIWLPYKEKRMMKRRERGAGEQVKRVVQPFWGMLDSLGGMILNPLVFAFWIAIVLMILDFIISIPWGLPNLEAIRTGIFVPLLHWSSLKRVLAGFLSASLVTVKPWFYFFGGLPPIFDRLATM